MLEVQEFFEFTWKEQSASLDVIYKEEFPLPLVLFVPFCRLCWKTKNCNIINNWKFANIQHLTVMFWALDPSILKRVVYISVSFFLMTASVFISCVLHNYLKFVYVLYGLKKDKLTKRRVLAVADTGKKFLHPISLNP